MKCFPMLGKISNVNYVKLLTLVRLIAYLLDEVDFNGDSVHLLDYEEPEKD
jgi:hypothetical protein